MRRSLFVATVVAALAFCTDAFAQRYLSPRVGLMGGVTSSEAKIKDVDTKSVSLYHIGLTAELPLGGGFAIQPSLLYQVKGASADNIGGMSVSDLGKSFETKVGYLEVPVQIQWGPDLVLFRPYAFAEPFVGYRISSSNKEAAKAFKDELKKVEYGLGLGAGIDVWRLQISAKYFWNFGKIYETGDTAGDTIRDAVNNGNNFNGIMASVAFFF